MGVECRQSPNGKHDFEPDTIEVIKTGGGKERIFWLVCRWCGKAKPGKKKKTN